MVEKTLDIGCEYLNTVRLRSSKTFNIASEDVQMGHLLLQAWSENPDKLAQVNIYLHSIALELYCALNMDM